MSRGKVMLQVFNPRIQSPFLAVNAGAAAWYGEVAFLIPAAIHFLLIVPWFGARVRYKLKMGPVLDLQRTSTQIREHQGEWAAQMGEKRVRRQGLRRAEDTKNMRWDAHYNKRKVN